MKDSGFETGSLAWHSRPFEETPRQYESADEGERQVAHPAVSRARIRDEQLTLEMPHHIACHEFSVGHPSQFALYISERIDDPGNAIVSIAQHAHPVFNCAILSRNKMLTELRFAEPRIIR